MDIQEKTLGFQNKLMTVSYAFGDHHLYVEIEGELDAYTSEDLLKWWEVMHEALKARKIDDVQFNLDAVSYIDVAGLRSLIKIDGNMQDHGRQWVIDARNGIVDRMFDVSGLKFSLPVRETGVQPPLGDGTTLWLERTLPDSP